jgi:hypothetical protein
VKAFEPKGYQNFEGFTSDNPSHDHSRHFENKWATMITTMEHTLKNIFDCLSWLEFHNQCIDNTTKNFKIKSTHQHDAIDGKLISLQNIIKNVLMLYISQMTFSVALYIKNLM